MPRRPQPTTSIRVFLYARVSTADQAEGYSIDAQLELLRQYCKQRGFIIIEEFVDAQSGSRLGRKQFNAMLAALHAGRASAIVVEKVDRLTRNYPDVVKVDETGADVHLVKDGMIVGPNANSNDRFIYDINVVLARRFHNMLKEETKKGMVQKAKQGIFPSCAPIGYLNVDKGIQVDPDRGPLVTALFAAYATGRHSLQTLNKHAWEIGLRTRRGTKLPRIAIDRMLDNQVYIGRVKWGQIDVDGSHPPLVDLQTWQRVQTIKHGRNCQAGFAGKSPTPYRGVLKCGYCGCAVTSELKKGKYIYYRCTGMRDAKCPGKKYVREALIDEQIAAVLDCLSLSPSHLEQLRQALRDSMKEVSSVRTTQLSRIHRDVKQRRGRLERLYLDLVDGRIDNETYETLRQSTRTEIMELEIQEKALSVAEDDYYDLASRLLELAQTAAVRFKLAPMDIKREVVLELVQSGTMKDGIVQLSLYEPFQTLAQNNRERREILLEVVNGRPNETVIAPSWIEEIAAFHRAVGLAA